MGTNSAFEMSLRDITKVAKCGNNSRHVSRLMLHIVPTAIKCLWLLLWPYPQRRHLCLSVMVYSITSKLLVLSGFLSRYLDSNEQASSVPQRSLSQIRTINCVMQSGKSFPIRNFSCASSISIATWSYTSRSGGRKPTTHWTLIWTLIKTMQMQLMSKSWSVGIPRSKT